MVVKLIDDRWEVIHIIAEHNHPLVMKPSLTKYLHSHQGIPAEEKKLLTHLYDFNLTAGTHMPRPTLPPTNPPNVKFSGCVFRATTVYETGNSIVFHWKLLYRN